MAYFTFSSPWYLNFLFFIPLMIWVYVMSVSGRGKRAIKFANISAIERISGVEIFSRNLSILIVNIILVCCLALALSGTVLHVTKKASAFSYVIAIDASSSMNADDIEPTRLEAAKSAARDFVEGLPISTRVGVVSFSGVSYLERDVSDDKVVVKDAINTIEIKGVGGTNVLDAVINSVNLLSEEEARAIVLLSDGQINLNGIDEAIDYAKAKNAVIHTVGIGTTEGGETGYFISQLDEDALKAMAYNTNGRYYNVADVEDFGKVFDEISLLTEKVVGINLSVYMIVFAMVLIVMQWILINTHWRIIP